MRRAHPTALAATLLALASAPAAAADACGDLVDRVASAAKAEVGGRTDDFATFRVSAEITLTLACGGAYPSSVGAQFRGAPLTDAFFIAFGEAGRAVTGIDPAILTDAARKASTEAAQRRHGSAPAGRVLVTCAVKSAESGSVTLCAAIEKGDKT